MDALWISFFASANYYKCGSVLHACKRVCGLMIYVGAREGGGGDGQGLASWARDICKGRFRRGVGLFGACLRERRWCAGATRFLSALP
jgi:hypothetical protein